MLLFMLSAGRPRWALQLCRMASNLAKRDKSRLIKLAYIKHVLPKYSSIRVDDICREHQHQCPAIAELVNCFSSQRAHYTTDELLLFITSHVLSSLDLLIDGDIIVSPVDVARFLFRAGVINAMDWNEHNNTYWSYDEKPELLRYESNLDDGMQWTIQPAFRTALRVSEEG